MAGPHQRTYTQSGGQIQAGRFVGGFSGVLAEAQQALASSLYGYRVPAWIAGKPLNEWFAIPGTAVMATGAAAHAFCGAALAEVGGRAHLVIAAPGGHLDSSDNRVVSLDLMDDAPAWTLRHAASTAGIVQDQAYYGDGRPASRHTYFNTHYISQLDRVMLIGAPFVYGNGVGANAVDGFNLATNQWDGVVADQPGTSGSGYPNVTKTFASGCLDPATGNVWSIENYFEVWKWNRATGSQGSVASFGTQPKGPSCWDTLRNKYILFGLGSGGSMADAWIYAGDGLTRQALTFSGSAAHTALAATSVDSASVVYDPVADKFYWFRAANGNDIYVITPNAGTTWDISLMSQGAGTVAPPTGGFTYSRFRYVPSLGGLVYVPAIGGSGSTYNTLFMRLR